MFAVLSVHGYCPDRTDRNMGIDQTEQPKIAIGQTEGVTQIFSRPLGWVARDPPPHLRDPSRSGRCLSWVVDFILGNFRKCFSMANLSTAAFTFDHNRPNEFLHFDEMLSKCKFWI